MEEQARAPQSNLARPPLLEELTITQAAELEEQVIEDDRAGFFRRTEAFGWPRDQAEQVWTWMRSGQVVIEATSEE